MHSSVLRRGLEWLGGSWLVWLAMVSCSAGTSPGAARDGAEPPELETGGTLAASGGVADGAGGRPALSGGVTSTGGRSATATTGGESYIPPVMAQPMPAAGIEYERVERPCDKTFDVGGVSTRYATLALPGSALAQRALVLWVNKTFVYAKPAGFEGLVGTVMLGEDSVGITCPSGETSITFLVPKL